MSQLPRNEEYAQAVRTLAKPGQQIIDETSSEQWKLLDLSHQLSRFSQACHTIAIANLRIIANPLESEKPNLAKMAYDIHMAGALEGECGEIYDALKRHVVYRIGLDTRKECGPTLRENLIEEIGDVLFYATALIEGDGMRNPTMIQNVHDAMFYLGEIAKKIGASLEEAMAKNLEKLRKRYGDKLTYSNDAAENRADKKLENS